MGEVEVVPAGLDRLEELVGLWELLHSHQSSVCAPVAGLDLRTATESAEIVRPIYRDWLTGSESFAFLATEDRRPVGYIIGFYEQPHFMWAADRIGHVDSFFVLPEMRGRGVGRRLMEAAYDEMRRAGATAVALEVVAENEVARRFYERDGYTTTWVQMHRQLT